MTAPMFGRICAAAQMPGHALDFQVSKRLGCRCCFTFAWIGRFLWLQDIGWGCTSSTGSRCQLPRCVYRVVQLAFCFVWTAPAGVASSQVQTEAKSSDWPIKKGLWISLQSGWWLILSSNTVSWDLLEDSSGKSTLEPLPLSLYLPLPVLRKPSSRPSTPAWDVILGFIQGRLNSHHCHWLCFRCSSLAIVCVCRSLRS